jgi:hypothetical protein
VLYDYKEHDILYLPGANSLPVLSPGSVLCNNIKNRRKYIKTIRKLKYIKKKSIEQELFFSLMRNLVFLEDYMFTLYS